MVEENDLTRGPSLEDSVVFADNPEPAAPDCWCWTFRVR